MAPAVIASATIIQLAPNCGKKIMYYTGTSVNAADYITGSDYFKAVEGAHLVSTGGTVAAFAAFATTVTTLSNGATGTKLWSGFIWGY
jgi:hypothetical protein